MANLGNEVPGLPQPPPKAPPPRPVPKGRGRRGSGSGSGSGGGGSPDAPKQGPKKPRKPRALKHGPKKPSWRKSISGKPRKPRKARVKRTKKGSKQRKSGSGRRRYRKRAPRISRRTSSGRRNPFSQFGMLKRLVAKLKRYLKRQGAGRQTIRNHGFTGVGNNGQTGRAGFRR